MNLYVNTILCMIIGNGTNKYVITCFRILNNTLFKSKSNNMLNFSEEEITV